MIFPQSFSAFLVAIAFLSLCGCGESPIVVEHSIGLGQGEAGAGPFGPPDKPAILIPYEGDWVFDLEETLAVRKADGASAEEIEQARAMHNFYADHGYGGLLGDLTITGTVVMSTETIPSEYRLFNLHKHGATLCGKAWYHEDRYDPGDMQKCRIQLALKNNQLLLKISMSELPSKLDDPDRKSMTVVNSSVAATCDADTLSDDSNADWSPWAIYVFDKVTTQA